MFSNSTRSCKYCIKNNVRFFILFQKWRLKNKLERQALKSLTGNHQKSPKLPLHSIFYLLSYYSFWISNFLNTCHFSGTILKVSTFKKQLQNFESTERLKPNLDEKLKIRTRSDFKSVLFLTASYVAVGCARVALGRACRSLIAGAVPTIIMLPVNWTRYLFDRNDARVPLLKTSILVADACQLFYETVLRWWDVISFIKLLSSKIMTSYKIINFD